jgi:hypothetical protein
MGMSVLSKPLVCRVTRSTSVQAAPACRVVCGTDVVLKGTHGYSRVVRARPSTNRRKLFVCSQHRHRFQPMSATPTRRRARQRQYLPHVRRRHRRHHPRLRHQRPRRPSAVRTHRWLPCGRAAPFTRRTACVPRLLQAQSRRSPSRRPRARRGRGAARRVRRVDARLLRRATRAQQVQRAHRACSSARCQRHWAT